MNANLYSQIEDVLKGILVSDLGISAAVLQTISSTTPLLGHGIGLDSGETVALVLGIEEEFGISVPDVDLTAGLFANVGTLTQYVLCKLAETGAPEELCAGKNGAGNSKRG